MYLVIILHLKSTITKVRSTSICRWMDSWSREACNTLVKKVQVCTVCTVLLGLRTGFFCKFFSLKVKKIVQMSYLSCYWWNWYFRNVVESPPPWINILTLAHLNFCTDITFLSAFFLFLPIWVCTVLCTLRTFKSQELVLLYSLCRKIWIFAPQVIAATSIVKVTCGLQHIRHNWRNSICVKTNLFPVF